MIGQYSWDKLFEAPPFFMRYRHFIVFLVCSNSAEDQLEWCGLVTSKLRILIGMFLFCIRYILYMFSNLLFVILKKSVSLVLR